jgi:multiple antibiotic resistance protein
MYWSEFISVYLKYFFILTPFYILAVFLAITEHETESVRHRLAIRVTGGVIAISLILFWFGQTIFSVLGITVDAFRIGAGALLFISAVSLVQGKIQLPSAKSSIMDLAIVPLAIPMTIGPGSVGYLILMSNAMPSFADGVVISAALAASSLSVGVLLWTSSSIERVIGANGISMLSKVTGLILASLSCQMMFTGIAAFLK